MAKYLAFDLLDMESGEKAPGLINCTDTLVTVALGGGPVVGVSMKDGKPVIEVFQTQEQEKPVPMSKRVSSKEE